MGTTKVDIAKWFLEGKRHAKNTHMIVVCDSFDYEDYPVYVTRDQDVREVMKAYDGVNMQRIMEVYDLRMGIASQLAEMTAFHVD